MIAKAYKLTVTTAVPFSTIFGQNHDGLTEVVVQGRTGNTGIIYLGTSSVQCIEIDAGSEIILSIHSTRDLYLRAATANDYVHILLI